MNRRNSKVTIQPSDENEIWRNLEIRFYESAREYSIELNPKRINELKPLNRTKIEIQNNEYYYQGLVIPIKLTEDGWYYCEGDGTLTLN